MRFELLHQSKEIENSMHYLQPQRYIVSMLSQLPVFETHFDSNFYNSYFDSYFLFT